MTDYNKETVAKLRQVLKDRDIPMKGLTRKAQMIEKLEEWDAQNATEGEAENAPQAEAEAETAGMWEARACGAWDCLLTQLQSTRQQKRLQSRPNWKTMLQ